MTENIKIALDVMGGDHGPATVLAGAEISRKRYPEIRYILHGESDAVLPELVIFPAVSAAEHPTFHEFVHIQRNTQNA